LTILLAKNIILAGVRSVSLHDDAPTTLFDLSAQYYLTEKDIGHPRAQACVAKLAELNSYVDVNVHTGEITDKVLQKYQVCKFSN
jgi:ubiquitin-activating enzyme E1